MESITTIEIIVMITVINRFIVKAIAHLITRSIMTINFITNFRFIRIIIVTPSLNQ